MDIEDIQMFPKVDRTGEEVIGDPMKKDGNNPNGNNGVVVAAGDGNRLSRWHHHSSRIIRVSRASGGKDRHSKVWTSKGPRDRRVRLSVSTALQFYDLQDRLGYDQPSKAVEWLIKAAADAIAELPSLNATFPTEDERIASSENVIVQNQIPNLEQTASLSKSACSSNSDTSKNSGLSLSRSELRDKARERARERTAKEKERESHTVNDNSHSHSHASFTELLTSSVHAESETGSVNPSRQWMPSAAPMECFSSGLYLGSGQAQFPIQTVSIPFSSMSDQHQHDHHRHHHHPHHRDISFVPDHLISPGGGGSFNLDFNISSSSAMAGFNGLNRGTLQSNSQNQQSFLGNLQRFSSDGCGGGAPFFIGALPVENHNDNTSFSFTMKMDAESQSTRAKGRADNPL